MSKKGEGEGPKLHAMPGAKVMQPELAAIMRQRAIIRDDYMKLLEMTGHALTQIRSGAAIQGGLVQAKVVETQEGGLIRVQLLIDGHPADDISY